MRTSSSQNIHDCFQAAITVIKRCDSCSALVRAGQLVRWNTQLSGQLKLIVQTLVMST
jgi:hypothetical protein